VPRNAEAISGPSYAGAWFNSQEGSWYAEHVPLYFDAAGGRIVGETAADTPLSYGPGAAATALIFDTTNFVNTANGATLGAVAKMASRYKVGVGKGIVMNNGAVVSNATCDFTWAQFTLGVGNSAQQDGMIGRVWFIPFDVGSRIKDLTA
jgi:hypothetical protein